MKSIESYLTAVHPSRGQIRFQSQSLYSMFHNTCDYHAPNVKVGIRINNDLLDPMWTTIRRENFNPMHIPVKETEKW